MEFVNKFRGDFLKQLIDDFLRALIGLILKDFPEELLKESLHNFFGMNPWIFFYGNHERLYVEILDEITACITSSILLTKNASSNACNFPKKSWMISRRVHWKNLLKKSWDEFSEEFLNEFSKHILEKKTEKFRTELPKQLLK